MEHVNIGKRENWNNNNMEELLASCFEEEMVLQMSGVDAVIYYKFVETCRRGSYRSKSQVINALNHDISDHLRLSSNGRERVSCGTTLRGELLSDRATTRDWVRGGSISLLIHTGAGYHKRKGIL